MRIWTVTVAFFASCGTNGATPDAGFAECHQASAVASCKGTTASTSLTYEVGTTSQTICRLPGIMQQATCASCAVTARLEIDHDGGDIAAFAADPQVLCAETPEAKSGDSCELDSRGYRMACLPTRAKLAADGTVTGQDYLTCDPGTSRCVAASPPVIGAYLLPCDAATIARYGTAGAVGVVDLDTPANPAIGASACLVAWDAATNAAASGLSAKCMGDWECPAGALCDDRMTVLSGGPYAIGVCKPGPRGTLTPAMLAP
jgi:hypothetical protein